jgi:hypothetical protein
MKFFTLIYSLRLLSLYSHILVLKNKLTTIQTINQTMQWFMLYLKTQQSRIIQTFKMKLKDKLTSSDVNLCEYNDENEDTK